MNSRQEKLKKLDLKKPKDELVILTNGKDFLDSFQKKIDQLSTTLGVGVEVDAYDLIEELKNIQSFVPAIKELVDAVDSIHIPDFPELPEIPKSLEINGLVDINNSFKKQIELLEKIRNIKLPDIRVEVESINDKNTKKVTQKIESITERVSKTENASIKNTQKVIDKIDALINKVAINSKKDQSATNYVPYRRVRVVGNRAFFDDDEWTSRGSGSGSGNDDSAYIYDGATKLPVKHAPITITTSGAHEIVAPPAGKRIKLLSYVIISNGITTFSWTDDESNVYSGDMYATNYTGVSSGYNPKGHLVTNTGKSLYLNVGSDVSMGGHISYIEVS